MLRAKPAENHFVCSPTRESTFWGRKWSRQKLVNTFFVGKEGIWGRGQLPSCHFMQLGLCAWVSLCSTNDIPLSICRIYNLNVLHDHWGYIFCFMGYHWSVLYVCGLGWVVGYEKRPVDNSVPAHTELSPTPTLSVGVNRIFESVCLFVCLSGCPRHNSKTNDLKVFKLGIGNDLEIY